jgi:U32 family peptidase
MENRLGVVTHFYNRASVAVLKLDGELKVGDTILFLGRSTDFRQPVGSMEIEHRKVTSVSAGAEVAVKVTLPVRRGDAVFKVVETANLPEETG